jgi:hypothetical protein
MERRIVRVESLPLAADAEIVRPREEDLVSFEFRHLRNLGNRVAVDIPKDENGFLGRECPQPDCEGYFKIKPGTGLKGQDLPCHCPYCGHTAGQNYFWTKDQIEYARSVALKQMVDAVRKDLKSLEFNQRPRPGRGIGIGISLKVQPGRPIPIKYFREQALETHVCCANCTLEYAVYGVFGFCPDCGIHNSLQTLLTNLELVNKHLALCSEIDDKALRQQLVEDALENCVSAFDGFGRECCRIRAQQAQDPEKAANVSFQNLPGAAKRLRSLFNVDLEGTLTPDEWHRAHVAFMRRHLLAHKAGVVDRRYLEDTGEQQALLGRRIVIEPAAVQALTAIIAKLGRALVSILPSIH